MYIFLDESGDLGFNFTKQGTSRYFTICLLVCDDLSTMRAMKNAIRKTLKNKVNRKRKVVSEEIKSTSITDEIKKYFLRNSPEKGWNIYAITINKQNINPHLQTKEGKKKLYNWMTKEVLSFVKIPKDTNSVYVAVDKCKDKRERYDFNCYINAYLIEKVSLQAFIEIEHKDSRQDYCLQAVDLFCSGIRHKSEGKSKGWYNAFKGYIKKEKLYFKGKSNE